MEKQVLVRDPHALYCDDPSLTVQSFRDECDVNLIVKRFRNVHGRDYEDVACGFPEGMFFGDFSDVCDYQTALESVRRADESFNRLDPKVRARFDNDPGKFLDFCSDPKNLEDLREMGLAVKRPSEVVAEPKVSA